MRIDTLPGTIDTSHIIDPVSGDTVIVYDTVVAPVDTTPHWVGNSALLITEVAPVNLDWLDENGSDPGWIEIYNAGSEPANLKGYSLVENTAHPRKWVFGDEPIGPKSFRTVFCDRKDQAQSFGNENTHARAHTNWKLNSDGGTVYLIDRYYGIRDSVKYPALTAGMSWGIVDGGAWKYFDKPTPEEPNTKSTAYDDVAPDFEFKSGKAGFYNEELVLNPPSAPEGIKIRCTQDGSLPTKNSPVFDNSITFEKSTSFRCAAFKDGMLTKKVVTNTYFINETVKMPVVAISVDSAFFEKHYLTHLDCTNPKDCPSGLMEDVEFPVHVEYFENGSSTKEKTWEIDAGISIMGGWSRVADKKSVSIKMGEEYQTGWLHYPLFETRKGVNDKYKAFNLRNNGNRFVSDYFEDALGGAILEGSGVDYQRSRQVVVFYNGKYYGIHDMRERFNKNYVETNYDIDAGTVNFVKHLNDTVTASSGTPDNYVAMLNFVGSNDMAVADNYTMAKTLLDVGNLADYMAAQIYVRNGDWPNNNVRAWRSPDHPWKFMVYDLDHGFGWKWGVNDGEFNGDTKMFSWIKKGGGNKPCKAVGCFANLYISLIENPDFRRMFINRSAVMFNSYTNAKNVEKVRSTMAATLIESETARDLEKFHQNEKNYPEGFTTSGSRFTEWAEERDRTVLDEYKEEFEEITGEASMTIATSGKGNVLMEGMTLPGSTSSSTKFTGKFFAGVAVELTAVPAAGSMFIGWDDGEIANPRLVPVTDGLTITAKFQ
ncbi:MAG: CotH kinase family protein [Fibrobacter sp.]|nr:CotH kinase family protein [Fibrobacter sp.]